jgi:hypothetical protein
MSFFKFLKRVDISNWYDSPQISSMSYNAAKKQYTIHVVVPEAKYNTGYPVYFYPPVDWNLQHE